MINQKTLFILGAGASCPYNYPSGKELRKRICFDFVKNYKKIILRNLDINEYSNSITTYLKSLDDFSKSFFKSSNKSIDLFLARNPSLVDLGKFAISLEILKAEQYSNFRERIKNTEHDWYSYLFERLTDTFLDKENHSISNNEISFITFNYDRSLEQFLFESLYNSFEDLKDTEAAKEINQIPIIHVFGKVAPLPWQADDYQEYKSKLTELSILLSTNNIFVMNEDLKDKVIVGIRELILNAQRIFFLGFGYLKENLQLLDFPHILKDYHEVYGTGLGLTKREIKERHVEFFYPGDTQSTNIIIEKDFDSLMLLKEYL